MMTTTILDPPGTSVTIIYNSSVGSHLGFKGQQFIQKVSCIKRFVSVLYVAYTFVVNNVVYYNLLSNPSAWNDAAVPIYHT
jgi:hypothetical protein